MATNLKTDLAKFHQGSQPEADFWEWVGVLLGGSPELRCVWLTGFQARERMKTLILILGTRLEHQRREVPKGTPKSESEDSHLGSAWERLGEDSRRVIGRPTDGGVSF